MPSRRSLASWSRAAILGLSTGIAACDADAGTIRFADERLLIGGDITDEDTRTLARALREDPHLTTLVFEQCRGGTLSAAYGFADLIKLRRLQTVASGPCASACALAFLAGARRSFGASSALNWVALHAARRPDGSGPSSDALNRQMLGTLKTFTSGKLSSELLQLIAKSWSARSGVFFVRAGGELSSRDGVWYCDGRQGSDPPHQCKRLPGFDPLSQGIVTEP